MFVFLVVFFLLHEKKPKEFPGEILELESEEKKNDQIDDGYKIYYSIYVY